MSATPYQEYGPSYEGEELDAESAPTCSALEVRTIKTIVTREGAKIFEEAGFLVEIDDEAAGEFVVVTDLLDGYGKIAINPTEWPTLRKEIDRMIAACRENDFHQQNDESSHRT